MYHILQNVWLGSQQDADDLIRNNPERISAILNVRGPDAYRPPGRDQSAQHPDKAYKWIPAPDIEQVYPAQLKEANDWLREQSSKGARILIHCMHGISRSPAFLAAYMVEARISANLNSAVAAIAQHCQVQPAKQVSDAADHISLVSPLTGLPNGHAFDRGRQSAFVAVVDIERMKQFNDYYGAIAGDALLQKLARILLESGLDTYHRDGAKFLCKGDSRLDLEKKLLLSLVAFRRPFQVYADGRLQTVEGAQFCFSIAPTELECAAAIRSQKLTNPSDLPEWLRTALASGQFDRGW